MTHRRLGVRNPPVRWSLTTAPGFECFVSGLFLHHMNFHLHATTKNLPAVTKHAKATYDLEASV